MFFNSRSTQCTHRHASHTRLPTLLLQHTSENPLTVPPQTPYTVTKIGSVEETALRTKKRGRKKLGVSCDVQKPAPTFPPLKNSLPSPNTHKVTLPAPGPPPFWVPGWLGGHGWPATPVQPGPSDGRQHGADAAQPELEAPVNPVSQI